MGKNITAVVEEYDKILNERIDKGVESLRKYKETRAEALKITTPKLGSWPSDPTIKTIGDLFGYVFHNPEGGEKWEPSVMQAGHTAVGDYFSDINGKNSDDKTIFDKYKVLSDTYRKPPKYLDAIKKKGGGQYWFDFIMYFMYKLMKKQGPWKKAAVGPSWPGEKTKSPEKKVSDLATLKDFEDYVYYESEFLDSANQESFTTYKGLLDLIEPLDLLYDELLYQAVLEAGDEYIGKYTAEIDKIYTEKGDSLLITYLDIVPDPKPVPEISTTSTVVSTQSVKMIDSDFTFNVEKENIFVCPDTAIGELTIIKKEEVAFNTVDPISTPTSEEQLLDSEYDEQAYGGEEEKDNVFETLQNNSLDDPNPTEESTKRIDDATIDANSYVGEKWKSFDVDAAISKINKTKHRCDSKFRGSLKKVLIYIKNDTSIDDVRKAAYLLGTAYAESGYSLQRWEADYLQFGTGIPYPEIKKVNGSVTGGPKQSILDYYRSTKGKKDYYLLGTDTYGFPYFGRGLIQLTGKENYALYGKKIGQDLLKNGDLALEPQNSYKIAMEYMKSRTFGHVLKNNLEKARKSVNGGTKAIEEVNGAYSDWLTILKETTSIA